MIRNLLVFVKQHKLQFAGALLLATATIAAGIGLMSSSGYLISRAAQRPMIVDLFMVTAAVRFFGISRAVVRYFERLVSHDLTFKILLSMRSLLYRKLDALSLDWMMGKRPGDLLSRIITDIEILQHIYLRIISPAIVAVLIALMTGFLLWLFDPVLAAVAIVFLIFSGLILPIMAIKLGKGRGEVDIVTKADMKVFLVDRLQGMQDVLWLGQKRDSGHILATMQARLDKLQHKNAGTAGLLEGLSGIFANMGAFFVLILAIPLALAGEIKGVMLAMLTLGVLSSFEAVQGFGTAFLQFETTAEATKRLFSITQASIPIAQPDVLSTIPAQHDISFHDVSFSYMQEHIALANISFTIPQGSKTAIVGPSGSGKTTLINLILRFWEINQGWIALGGIDIKQLDVAQLRSLFAVTSQDAYIFNRSLRDNLLIARPGVSDEILMRVMKTVGLESFANNLDLEPGSHGMRMSGGERQLFALARALLKDAAIWIFDEPTANLDPGTERRILDTIWLAGQSRTRIMITHRLLDMDKMDQIIVMDRGSIVERGSHSELLARGGLYSRMYKQQLQVVY